MIVLERPLSLPLAFIIWYTSQRFDDRASQTNLHRLRAPAWTTFYEATIARALGRRHPRLGQEAPAFTSALILVRPPDSVFPSCPLNAANEYGGVSTARSGMHPTQGRTNPGIAPQSLLWCGVLLEFGQDCRQRFEHPKRVTLNR